MEIILKSGWCNVFRFIYRFLTFASVFSSSLVFGAETGREMNPPTYNPYQAIYDAYLYDRPLDNASIRQVANFYAAKSTHLDGAKNAMLFQKKFLMLVGMENVTEGFFTGEDRCRYDQDSISERSKLREAVNYISSEEVPNSQKKNALFTFLLKIDEYQDLNRLDDVLDNLQSLVRNDHSDIDSSFHAYFRQWLDFIKEEEDINVLVKITLRESASRAGNTKPIERIFPILRCVALAGGAIGAFYLTLPQPVSNIMAMNNLYNVSFSNITTNDSRLLFINLCNITLGPIFELNGTKFISSLNGTTFDIAEKTYASPVNRSLVITTFVTATVLSVLDLYYNAAHHIAYYFFLLWGTNIESIPNSISDLFAQEAKKIKSIEFRKSFIKEVGDFISDTLKKTRSQESFVEDVTKKINSAMQDYYQGV